MEGASGLQYVQLRWSKFNVQVSDLDFDLRSSDYRAADLEFRVGFK